VEIAYLLFINTWYKNSKKYSLIIIDKIFLYLCATYEYVLAGEKESVEAKRLR